MSSVVTCPFGCASTRNELLMFKQISINYFDQIMVKFNNQDRMINDLVVKLDQCLNFNYQYSYGGDHSIPYQASYNINEPDHFFGDTVNNDEIVCFVTDDEIEVKYSDVRGESFEEAPSQLGTAIEAIQDELVIPSVPANIELVADIDNEASATSSTTSLYSPSDITIKGPFRRDMTRQTKGRYYRGKMAPSVRRMSAGQVRNKCSTRVPQDVDIEPANGSYQSMPQTSEFRSANEWMQDESIIYTVQENHFLPELQPTSGQFKTGPIETSDSSAAGSSNSSNNAVKRTFRRSGGGMVGPRPSIDGMTAIQIRHKYSTGDDDEPIKCKLCRKEFPWTVCHPSLRTSNFASHIKHVHRASGELASVYSLMKKHAKKLKKGDRNGKFNVGQPKIEEMAVAQSGDKQSTGVEHSYVTYPTKRPGRKCRDAIKIEEDETITTTAATAEVTTTELLEPQSIQFNSHSIKDSPCSATSLNSMTSRRGGIRPRGGRIVSEVAGSRPSINGMTSVQIRNKYSTGDDTETIICKLCGREFLWNASCHPTLRTSNFVSHIKNVHRAIGTSTASGHKRAGRPKRKTTSEVPKEEPCTEEQDDDSQSVISPCQNARQESEFSAALGVVEAEAIIPSPEQDTSMVGNESSQHGTSVIEPSTTPCSTASNSTKCPTPPTLD